MTWFIGAGWVLGWLLFWRLPTLTPAEASRGSDEGVSVIIPARDEADVLPGLLGDLAAQTVLPSEVVVVDDMSEDGTGAVARALGARVVAVNELPDGWTGKSHACQTGADATTASLLLFLDADVRLAPAALESLLAEADQSSPSSSFLSIQPSHVMHKWYEPASAGGSVVSVMGVGLSAALPLELRGAFGPCLLVDRASYVAVGGHRSGRAAIADDMALAARLRDAGYPTRALAGGPLVRYRMYPAGWRQLWEGWTKNLSAGAGGIPSWRFVAIALWIAAGLSSFGAVVAAARHPSPLHWIVAILSYLAFAGQWRWMLRQLGGFPYWTGALYPILLVVFVALFVRSSWLEYARRRVRWRGRSIPVGGSSRGATP